MGALITIGVGIVFLGVPFDPAAVDWISLVIVMTLGLVAIVAIGVMLAAVCLQTRQESWSYPDAVAGALFLVSAAVFPLAVLPLAVQAIGLVNPLTWWIQGVRTAMFPGGVNAIGGSGSLWTQLTGSVAPDTTTTVLVLLATGTLVTLAATTIFRISERRARDRGLLDRTTGS
jgi:ABC-2 type transport system permease protein